MTAEKSSHTPTQRAMKAAVDMEVHAAISTRTDAKAKALDEHFPGYDAMVAALDRIFSYVSYVNIHGVGEQPEPREDGQPQPMRVPPEEFARIFQEIGTLASFALMKASRP